MKRLSVLSGILLLVTLSVVAQPGNSQSTPEVTPVAVTEFEVAPEMESAPDNCGIPPEPVAIDPMIPDAFGAWPFWVALSNESDEARSILFVPNEHNFTDPDLEGWWVTKVGWFIANSYHGEVHLQGFNVDDHSPMYFEFGDSGPVDQAVLNPEHPGGFVDGLDRYAFFPSHVWVSKAGCYRLESEWDGGMWQQVIAVGNIED